MITSLDVERENSIRKCLGLRDELSYLRADGENVETAT
jgi:hypothetical protein